MPSSSPRSTGGGVGAQQIGRRRGDQGSVVKSTDPILVPASNPESLPTSQPSEMMHSPVSLSSSSGRKTTTIINNTTTTNGSPTPTPAIPSTPSPSGTSNVSRRRALPGMTTSSSSSPTTTTTTLHRHPLSIPSFTSAATASVTTTTPPVPTKQTSTTTPTSRSGNNKNSNVGPNSHPMWDNNNNDNALLDYDDDEDDVPQLLFRGSDTMPPMDGGGGDDGAPAVTRTNVPPPPPPTFVVASAASHSPSSASSPAPKPLPTASTNTRSVGGPSQQQRQGSVSLVHPRGVSMGQAPVNNLIPTGLSGHKGPNERHPWLPPTDSDVQPHQRPHTAHNQNAPPPSELANAARMLSNATPGSYDGGSNSLRHFEQSRPDPHRDPSTGVRNPSRTHSSLTPQRQQRARSDSNHNNDYHQNDNNDNTYEDDAEEGGGWAAIGPRYADPLEPFATSPPIKTHKEQVRDPLAKYLERLDSRTTTPAPMNPNLKKAAPLTSPSSTTAPTKFQPTLLPTASKALKGATTAQQQRPPARSTPLLAPSSPTQPHPTAPSILSPDFDGSPVSPAVVDHHHDYDLRARRVQSIDNNNTTTTSPTQGGRVAVAKPAATTHTQESKQPTRQTATPTSATTLQQPTTATTTTTPPRATTPITITTTTLPVTLVRPLDVLEGEGRRQVLFDNGQARHEILLEEQLYRASILASEVVVEREETVRLQRSLEGQMRARSASNKTQPTSTTAPTALTITNDTNDSPSSATPSSPSSAATAAVVGSPSPRDPAATTAAYGQPQTHNLLLANKYANDINTKPTHPTTKQPTPQHQHDEHESESAALRDLAEALRGEVDGLTGAYIDQERIQRAILITNEMREYDILSQLRRCVVRGLHWPTTVHSDERRERDAIVWSYRTHRAALQQQHLPSHSPSPRRGVGDGNKAPVVAAVSTTPINATTTSQSQQPRRPSSSATVVRDSRSGSRRRLVSPSVEHITEPAPSPINNNNRRQPSPPSTPAADAVPLQQPQQHQHEDDGDSGGDTDDVDFKRRLNGMSEADKKLVQERLEALLHHGLQLIRRDEPERRTLLSSSERLGRDGIYRDAAVGWGEAQRRELVREEDALLADSGGGSSSTSSDEETSTTTSPSSPTTSSSSMPSSIEHLTPSSTHRNLIAKRTPTPNTTASSPTRHSHTTNTNGNGRVVVFHAVGTFRNQLREIEFTEASIRNETVKTAEPAAWEGLMWRASAGLAAATGTSSKRGLVCSVESSRREAILKAASLASMELFQHMLDDRNDAEERTFERELLWRGNNINNNNNASTPTKQRTSVVRSNTSSPRRGGSSSPPRGGTADHNHLHHQPPWSPAGVHVVASRPNDDISTHSAKVSAAVSGVSSMTTSHTHDHPHPDHHYQHPTTPNANAMDTSRYGGNASTSTTCSRFRSPAKSDIYNPSDDDDRNNNNSTSSRLIRGGGGRPSTSPNISILVSSINGNDADGDDLPSNIEHTTAINNHNTTANTGGATNDDGGSVSQQLSAARRRDAEFYKLERRGKGDAARVVDISTVRHVSVQRTSRNLLNENHSITLTSISPPKSWGYENLQQRLRERLNRSPSGGADHTAKTHHQRQSPARRYNSSSSSPPRIYQATHTSPFDPTRRAPTRQQQEETSAMLQAYLKQGNTSTKNDDGNGVDDNDDIVSSSGVDDSHYPRHPNHTATRSVSSGGKASSTRAPKVRRAKASTTTTTSKVPKRVFRNINNKSLPFKFDFRGGGGGASSTGGDEEDEDGGARHNHHLTRKIAQLQREKKEVEEALRAERERAATSHNNNRSPSRQSGGGGAADNSMHPRDQLMAYDPHYADRVHMKQYNTLLRDGSSKSRGRSASNNNNNHAHNDGVEEEGGDDVTNNGDGSSHHIQYQQLPFSEPSFTEADNRYENRLRNVVSHHHTNQLTTTTATHNPLHDIRPVYIRPPGQLSHPSDEDSSSENGGTTQPPSVRQKYVSTAAEWVLHNTPQKQPHRAGSGVRHHDRGGSASAPRGAGGGARSHLLPTSIANDISQLSGISGMNSTHGGVAASPLPSQPEQLQGQPFNLHQSLWAAQNDGASIVRDRHNRAASASSAPHNSTRHHNSVSPPSYAAPTAAWRKKRVVAGTARQDLFGGANAQQLFNHNTAESNNTSLVLAGGGESPPKGRGNNKPFRVGRGSYLDIFVRQKDPTEGSADGAGEGGSYQPALRRSNTATKNKTPPPTSTPSSAATQRRLATKVQPLTHVVIRGPPPTTTTHYEHQHQRAATAPKSRGGGIYDTTNPLLHPTPHAVKRGRGGVLSPPLPDLDSPTSATTTNNATTLTIDLDNSDVLRAPSSCSSSSSQDVPPHHRQIMVPTARSNTHDRGVGAVIGAGSEAVVPVRNSRVSSRAPSANAKVPRPTTTTTGARATTTTNAGGKLPRSSSSSATAVGNNINVAVLSRPTASTKARKAVTSSSSPPPAHSRKAVLSKYEIASLARYNAHNRSRD